MEGLCVRVESPTVRPPPLRGGGLLAVMRAGGSRGVRGVELDDETGRVVSHKNCTHRHRAGA